MASLSLQKAVSSLKKIYAFYFSSIIRYNKLHPFKAHNLRSFDRYTLMESPL